MEYLDKLKENPSEETLDLVEREIETIQEDIKGSNQRLLYIYDGCSRKKEIENQDGLREDLKEAMEVKYYISSIIGGEGKIK